jgi:hypothetical protein
MDETKSVLTMSTEGPGGTMKIADIPSQDRPCTCRYQEDIGILFCPLHQAAAQMLDVLKFFLKQDRVQRATQQTDIGLATAADRALAVIARVERQP